MNKIPLVVLVYDNHELTKQCLENFKELSDKLDIYVVENKSKDTGKISGLCAFLLDFGYIKKYILFEENISNNAIEVVFRDNLIDLNSEYIILTDGDLIPDKNWLNEHLSLLDTYDDIFVVGNSLKPDNLPTKAFPGCESWLSQDIKHHASYIESKFGTHLLTFRTKEFKQMVKHFLQNKLKFCDTNYHKFGSDIMKKKSARTILTSSYHLVWDLYKDKNHPYTQKKINNKNIWNHNKYCNYEVYE